MEDTFTPTTVPTSHRWPMVNTNEFWGAFWSLLGGTLLSFLLDYALSGLIELPLAATIILGVGLGTMYFVLTQHQVPVANRGIVLLLGKRYRMGPGTGSLDSPKRGLQEGYNWLPLPPPFMTVRNEDVRERKLEFEQMDAYTKEAAIADTDGFCQYVILDPYAFVGAENPVDSLNSMVFQAIRNVIKGMTARSISQADKKHLSELIETELRNSLAEDGNPDGTRWGLYVIGLYIEDARVPALEAAWSSIPREEEEGKAEQIQVSRRMAQVDTIVAKGVDPALALSAAQIEVEKPGAKMNTINIPGLKESLESISAGIGKVLEHFGGGTK